MKPVALERTPGAAFPTPPRTLAIGHDHVASLGWVGDALEEFGHHVTMIHVVPESRFDHPNVDFEFPDPSDWDAIVTTGAPWPRELIAAWLPREISFLRRAHDLGIPILGICFGGQLLAEALGGSVRHLESPRIGWSGIYPSHPRIPGGPWFHWNSDQMESPPGAEILATSSSGCEAFACGTSLGLQFHPEMTTELLDDWLAAQGVDHEEPWVRRLREQTGMQDRSRLRQQAADIVRLLFDRA